jgi:dimethylhistidine N-methyltransferase
MAQCIGENALLVELGAGSSLKTRLLLEHLKQPAGYVPIDISRSFLLESAQRLARQYPDLAVLPVCADYHQPFELPTPRQQPDRIVAYFPGSTIGNLDHDTAREFLRSIAERVGLDGGLLIGVDLRKDPSILIPAYSDGQGVTAAFNYNLLHRINREAPADFDVASFQHAARWHDEASRMESHLVSQTEQTVTVAGKGFCFEPGESIWVESSYKYSLDGFAALADAFNVERVWMDPQQYFSVQYLSVRP